MIQRKVLSNGMTVLFKQRKNGVVSVAFAARHGGRNEFAKEKGISHFIEHMLYKGTPNRNALKISTEIERNGGELNGFTSEQITAYWCKMPSKHLNVALEVLSDMVKNPLFDPKEVDKERKVIFEEMKMYKDNPGRYVFDKIKELLYKGDFAISVIGTEESMKNNTREKLKNFFNNIYSTDNLIMAVVGDADFDEVIKFAEKAFKKTSGKISSPKIILSNGQKIEKRVGIDQANLVFARHAPLPNNKLHYAEIVLIALLAGGMSSRLFTEVREKRNLAYSIRGTYDAEKDYAHSWIHVGTPPKNVDKVKELIIKEFNRASKDIKEKELEQVKEQIIGNNLISYEDSHNILVDLLMAEIRNNISEFEEFEQNIRNVKLADVKKLAKLKDYSFFALVPE